jgi:hypothetical protein
MKFNLAISILIHENPSFFEIQCINIRHYYPNAKIFVYSLQSERFVTIYTKMRQILQILVTNYTKIP